MMAVSIPVNFVISLVRHFFIHGIYILITNDHSFQDKTSVLLVVVLLAVQATNHHHSNRRRQALVSVAVLLVVGMRQLVLMVLPVVQVDTSHHHSPATLDMALVLVKSPEELSALVDQAMNHQAPKYNNMLLILKVSSTIQTHKLSVVQLLAVYKHTHKTSEFASFNHQLFHHQA
jgi:hypothetical protein